MALQHVNVIHRSLESRAVDIWNNVYLKPCVHSGAGRQALFVNIFDMMTIIAWEANAGLNV